MLNASICSFAASNTELPATRNYEIALLQRCGQLDLARGRKAGIKKWSYIQYYMLSIPLILQTQSELSLSLLVKFGMKIPSRSIEKGVSSAEIPREYRPSPPRRHLQSVYLSARRYSSCFILLHFVVRIRKLRAYIIAPRTNARVH